MREAVDGGYSLLWIIPGWDMDGIWMGYGYGWDKYDTVAVDTVDEYDSLVERLHSKEEHSKEEHVREECVQQCDPLCGHLRELLG
jgi:hypothetical protein